ncbi:hypothetical protein [Bradyrhizobium cenepequi]|uniref:hypothetical protein n=1 Tax=Bradyrhizobium cenepequi TaxID=2821403 RepID=UPI001CE352AF|nr:hypothetical protein [Bradyrhizobium cenepequi]MCA6108015.1 hypothetical protein [Bradyrhizobium cenepequi]
MMSWQMITVLESIAKIERMFRRFREMIDTDESIPPELRVSLHATLDERLLVAKERLFNSVGKQNGATAMPISHRGTTRSD